MENEILTITQTAKYLQTCDKTIRRLIKDKELTASRVGYKAWRVRKSDIDEYLFNHTNGNEGKISE